ncbi:MAG: hypothetical protein J6T43_10740 [Prevotella sp.]|nr:hypothetical protein [Prevotella sp.]
MKKTLFLASSAMTMILAGCTSEAYEPEKAVLPESSNHVTLTVSAVTKSPDLVGDPETRIAYGSEDATWEEGDKIFLIKSDGTTITLTLSDGAGTSTGSFTSTDAVTAGSYTPYAVSATSLSKGYVSVSDGAISLDLSTAGGGTLADALEHDILKGDALELTDDQAEAEITGLTTHILSYLRFRFTSESKAIASIGMKSAGGVYKTVTIASDGNVSGSDASTDVVSVTASDDGAGTYAGYFAVYGSTNTSLLAHAEDADGGKYSRLVSTKEATYTAGTVYGKTFTLSEDMVTADASGTLSDQTWKNLGLSVKWSEYYVYTSEEFAYNRSFDTNGNTDPPASWSGWRLPTREEVNELYYASTLEWISSDTGPNGMKFNCNGNYIAMGASGYYYDWEVGDRVSQEGENIYFFIDEKSGDNRLWSNITSTGLSFANAGSRCTNVRCFTYYGAMRLVCDY